MRKKIGNYLFKKYLWVKWQNTLDQLNVFGVTFICFLFLSFIVIAFSKYNNFYCDSGVLNNILVEIHGSLIELFVLGIGLFFITKKIEERLEAKNYIDKINDLNSIKSKDYKKQIILNLRKLNRMKLSRFSLEEIDFSKENLKGMNLHISNLKLCNFYESNLKNVNFSLVNLHLANFKRADLENANFQYAVANVTYFIDCNLVNVNFSNTDLSEAIFINSYLGQKIEFSMDNFIFKPSENTFSGNLTYFKEGANLENAILKDAVFINSDLKGVKNLTINQLLEAKTLYNCKLDDNLVTQLLEIKPQLFEEYTFDDVIYKKIWRE